MTLSANFKPLYQQVYDVLVARLVDSYWKPSESLPSEYALAKELGVSQGTVRKALNQMVTENMLERKQGKGTYVAEHTQENSLLRFFRFREPGGENLSPETKLISVTRRSSTVKEQKQLSIKSKSLVIEMIRLRSINNKPTILEKVIQPLSVFPNLDKEKVIPNFLYALYQEKYGISISEVHEEIRAIVLNSKQAKLLKLPIKTPALLIERASINIDGRTVEWSEAFCSTEKFVYTVNLK